VDLEDEISYRRCCWRSRTALASGGRRDRSWGKLVRRKELRGAWRREWSPPIAFAPAASSADPSSSSCYWCDILLSLATLWWERGAEQIGSLLSLKRDWDLGTNGQGNPHNTQFSLQQAKFSLPVCLPRRRLRSPGKKFNNKWNLYIYIYYKREWI